MSRSKRSLFVAVTLALVATGLSFAIWAQSNRGDERARDGAKVGASPANDDPANSSAPGERARVLINENQNASSGATRPEAAVANKEQSARIDIGPNVHVSADRATLAHDEVILATHPTDSRYLLAGSIIHYGKGTGSRSLAYWSSDGGRKWNVSLEKKVDERGDVVGVAFGHDPTVAFGPDGAAYFAANPIGPIGIPLFRSSDHGKSWQQVATVGPGVLSDRPFLVADHSGTKHHGRLYCRCMFFPSDGTIVPILDETLPRGKAAKINGYALYSSDDRGGTFRDPPAWRIANPPYKTFGSINPVVLSDGTIVAPYGIVDTSDPEKEKRGILCAMRSIDGGRSLQGGARIGTWDINEKWTLGIPCFAASPKGAPHADRVFATWSDTRDGTHKILVAQSNDKGLTWSEGEAVDDPVAPEKGFGAFLPAIAINKDGVVGVSWYEIRDMPPGRSGWDVRFRASIDGGKTWLPSVRVSQKTSTFQGRGGWLGDTAGLATDVQGAFHVLWVDNRTGIQQVWTARLTVQRSE
jgi:hypothetical protein